MTECRGSGPAAWLFIATQPSSGSTLLADLLDTCRHAGRLAPRAEGQWLLPDLVCGANRWNAAAPRSLEEVRAVWLASARAAAPTAGAIVEKSPPNLCRMRRIMAVLADRPQRLVVLTRDPFAICSSWAARYGPEAILADWCPEPPGPIRGAPDFFRLLGRICGMRFAMQQGLLDICDLTLSYEALVRAPEAAVGEIVRICPELGAPDTAHPVFATVRDRNPALLARLSPAARACIREGFAPYQASARALGYALD